jgi:hypothetical protein
MVLVICKTGKFKELYKIEELYQHEELIRGTDPSHPGLQTYGARQSRFRFWTFFRKTTKNER